MIIEDGNITLSTGKELSANLGIIGLAPKGKDGWEISEGYDAGMWSEWYEAKTSDRKSTRLNSSHIQKSRMPSSA